MQIKNTLITLLLFVSFTQLNAQYAKNDTSYKDCFVGSTFFMLGNFLPTNKPDFVQLNLGYRLNHSNTISIELKTWKYAWSLGIPYGDSYEVPEEKYPGFIRERGFAIAYQKFWYKGFYTGIHIMNAWQSFHNEQGSKIDNGFQLFNTYRVGYHVKLFNDRFFIEPSLAVTHRPFQTKMPTEFKKLNNKWPKVFIGEPGLHFGYNF